MARGQVLPKETPYSTPIFRPTTVARRRSTPPSFSSSSSSPSNSWDSSSYGSSLVSFSFTNEDDELIPYSTSTNNNTSLRSSFRTAGIPFSWEEIPGIPKHQDINFKKKKESSSSPPLHLLPLPPSAGKSTSTRKKLHRISNKTHHQEDHIIISPKKHLHHIDIFQRDPFFAALVECSKDDDHDHDHRHHRHHDHGIVSSKITTARSLSERFGLVINMYTSCKTTCAVSESIVSLPRSAT